MGACSGVHLLCNWLQTGKCSTLQAHQAAVQPAAAGFGRQPQALRTHRCGVQGTAATACAGLFGSLTVQDKPLSDITEQRFVVVGAGSAGMGVSSMLALSMQKYVRPTLACTACCGQRAATVCVATYAHPVFTPECSCLWASPGAECVDWASLTAAQLCRA